jgi:alpha-soluble NSF attachment protein
MFSPHHTQGPTSAQEVLKGYTSHYAAFSSTREARLIGVICDSFDAGDLEAFTTAVIDYDRYKKLDEWESSMLLKIKRTIPVDVVCF